MNWKKAFPTLICCLLAFLCGALAGGFTGRPAATGQMLAGGAIVLFHMLIGGLLGVALAAYLAWRWPPSRLWKLAAVLAVGTLVLGLATRSAVAERRAARAAGTQETLRRVDPPASQPATSTTGDAPPVVEQEMSADQVDRARGEAGVPLRGFGFVHVPFTREGVRLLFYPDNDFSSAPTDSLIYASVDNRNVLRYAPPYLLPFYRKEDYDSMILRLLGVGDHRVLLEMNETTGQRAWVDKQSVHVAFWPQFLAEVFAVHALDPDDNPVRIKPQDGAAVETRIATDDLHLLLSGEVIGDWIHVRTMPEGGEPAVGGWLRWRRADRLLVGWDYRL